MRILAFLTLLLVATIAQARCTGDCGGGGSEVSVDELILGVSIALGQTEPAACPAFPACDIGPVCISDLIRAVRNALEGCPAPQLPAITATDPPANATDVARTTWLRLEFASAVDPADFRDLVSIECGAPPIPTAVRITALSPTTLVVDPIGGELTTGAACTLVLPGSTVPFTVAGAGAPAIIHYDRADTRDLAPFPDDAFFVGGTDGGTLDIPIPDGPDDVKAIFGGLLKSDIKTLSGFSPIGYWVIELSDAVDPDSIPLMPAASLDPAATVLLMDVTVGAPTYGQRIPFRLEPRTDVNTNAVVSHTLLLFPSIPLTEYHQYGLVITRRVLADPTRPFQMSDAMAGCFGETDAAPSAECERIIGVADQLLAAAAVGGPAMDRDDVALVLRATIGATTPISRDQVEVKRQMVAAEPPAYSITTVAPGTSGDVAAVVSGTWQAPEWREANNFFRRDANGKPQQVRVRAVPFTLALPAAALQGPVPIVMYQHGNPGSSENEVPSAARRSLAGQGFAVIGFTDILNRELSAGITDPDQAILAQVAPVLAAILDVGRIPDYWAETRAEQIAFLRFIDGLGTLDVLPIGAPDGIPDLAPDQPRMYLGISEGANNGPGILPYAPEIKAAALVAGGARLSEVLLHQADDLFLTALGSLYPNMTPSDIWIGVSLFQHLFDRQDAHNHAPFLYRAPVALPGDPPQRASVLLVEGLDDTLVPNHATNSLAWSFGPLPHLTPVQRPVPFLDVVDGPLQGNLAADRTGAFYQYVPTGVEGIDPTPGCAVLSPNIGGEGHYCAQSAAESFLQRATFFTSALTGVPVIIDPLAEGELEPVGMRFEELVR